jgi:hypothetical protein
VPDSLPIPEDNAGDAAGFPHGLAQNIPERSMPRKTLILASLMQKTA